MAERRRGRRRCARVARHAFLITVLTCGTSCWLLYGIGCCVLEPTGYYKDGDDLNRSSPAWSLHDSAAPELLKSRHWDPPQMLEIPYHPTRPRPGKLRRDELYILDKRRRRHRVEHSALGVRSELPPNGHGAAAAAEDATTTTQSWYRRAANMTASRKLPQALIIGVKKGGTRALLEFIRLHPDVRAVGPETHFFDRHYDRGLLWYKRQMPPTLNSQLTMEKTPSYFITKEVPARIYNMSTGMKLLVVVRDPVTRAISDYAQTASKRKDMRYFDELAFLNNATGLVDTSWSAVKIGVYAKHLERWLQFFPLVQFHFVSGENLIKDPAGEMEKVQDFLGLRRLITENHFYFNETKGFPCVKKSEGNGSPRCLGKTKGRVHPAIDPATIHRLRDFYRPFNLKFYQMTNSDFGWP